MSYSQYQGLQGHVKGLHRAVCWDYVMALVMDPCPLGLPQMLAAAFIALIVQVTKYRTSMTGDFCIGNRNSGLGYVLPEGQTWWI